MNRKKEFLSKMSSAQKLSVSAVPADEDRRNLALKISSLLGEFPKKSEAERIIYVALVVKEVGSYNTRKQNLGKKLSNIVNYCEKLIKALDDEDVLDFCIAATMDEDMVASSRSFINLLKKRIKENQRLVSTPGPKKNKQLHIFIEQLLEASSLKSSEIIIGRRDISSEGKKEYYGETFNYVFEACKLVFGTKNLSAETVGSLIEDLKEKVDKKIDK